MAEQAGRSVLVTGANSGIGEATALELAAAGFDVVGTVRSPDKADRLRAAAAERGLTVRTVLLDVDDSAACARAVDEVAGLTGGGPWGLVNNAGWARFGAVEDVTDDEVRAQLETNLVAPLRLARLVLPHMRAAGGGRIVNVSSVSGRISVPLLGWYSASKHALEGVSDALRVEVAADGVAVVLVEPGMFGTGVWPADVETGFPAPSVPRYARAYERAVGAARRSDLLPGPEWVARAVRLALSSPAPRPRYVVGADATVGLAVRRLLPTRVVDLVTGSLAGLRRP